MGKEESLQQMVLAQPDIHNTQMNEAGQKAIPFTIAKSGNNPKVHQYMNDRQSVVYTCQGISFSHKKESSTDTG